MTKEEMIAVLRDLNLVSGFRVSLHSADFTELAAYPEEKLPFCAFLHKASREEYERCLLCDKEAAKKAIDEGETVIYRCRHGLTEIIAPLYSFGVLTGYLMMGQVAMDGSDLREAEKCALRFCGNEEAAKALVGGIPKLPRVSAEAFVRITTICAEYLTVYNILPYAKRTVGQTVRQYVEKNYAERISIPEMCRALGYSKSTLCTSFRKEYGMTINDFITEVRLAAAKKLLQDKSVSIGSVAEAVGFRNQSYFSNLFVSECSMTPSEYRKRSLSEAKDAEYFQIGKEIAK